jgi:ribosome-associated toxin RatA of RatAB toxin-antitoxin module
VNEIDWGPPFELGAMPENRAMEVVDERLVRAPVRAMFELARDVERWPDHLAHYRWVRFHEFTADRGGIVEMAAWRPFGVFGIRAWWVSEMQVDAARPVIRFRHIMGITRGMDVEWSFAPAEGGTFVRVVHVWDGPPWPLIGAGVAREVIGPVFVHGIASRTLAGLAAAAERGSTAALAGSE